MDFEYDEIVLLDPTRIGSDRSSYNLPVWFVHFHTWHDHGELAGIAGDTDCRKCTIVVGGFLTEYCGRRTSFTFISKTHRRRWWLLHNFQVNIFGVATHSFVFFFFCVTHKQHTQHALFLRWFLFLTIEFTFGVFFLFVYCLLRRLFNCHWSCLSPHTLVKWMLLKCITACRHTNSDVTIHTHRHTERCIFACGQRPYGQPVCAVWVDST